MEKIRSFTSAIMGIFIAVMIGLSGCGSSDTAATPPTTAQLAAKCTSLVGTKIDEVTITATKWVAATGSLPAFCKVSATRLPFLDIEVDVPDNWSGRLWQAGGGGFDGTVRTALKTDATGAITDVDISLKTGLAVYAGSNGGNRAAVPAEAAPLVWTNGTLDGVASAEDYAYASLNTTREFAKSVTKAFYGRLPDRTYFSGCSNGGRNACIAAERWPQEYDGIVSGCYGMDMDGQVAGWMNMLGSRVGTPNMLSTAQWNAIGAAALTACDALDGVADGIIAKQSACNFDAATLQCGQPAASADTAICLTAGQVQTAKDLTSDVKLANGTTVYSGFNWTNFSQYAASFGVLGGGYAMLATGDQSWFTSMAKQQSYVLDRDYPLFQLGLHLGGFGVDKSKVAAYVASGKKLISWHVPSDNLVSAKDHIRNYTTMTNLAKGMGLTTPTNNTRFFTVPGTIHGNGATLDEVNWFNAITNWVEKNIAPEQLVYNRKDATTGVTRTLPVCQLPQYPKYNGTGDVNLAASYTCTAP
jgi:feruloyl esterase